MPLAIQGDILLGDCANVGELVCGLGAVALIHNEPHSDHVLKRDKRFQVAVRLPMSLSSCQEGRPIATRPEP